MDIHKMIEDLSLSDRVVLIEDAADEELPALLRHARVFIYPAIAEGFGMPPLEAMACGVPVVVSNKTSLPEVVGDAGVLVNPLDVDALTRAICSAMSDDPLRDRLRKAGPERAQRFSWQESARRVRERYLVYLEGRQ
jgi:glycosyltransferase involved in cell wall biosynthesis